MAETAHQDVAGVVALLHDLAPDDEMPNTRKAMLDAATLIESLSKALSEAEAKYAKIEKATAEEWFCGECGEIAFVGIRDYAAVQSRLSEAMKVIEPFARNVEALSLGAALGHIEREHLRAARAFLNAGKE